MVDPNIVPLDIPTIRVEGAQVVDIMARMLRAPVADIRIANFQTIHLWEPSGPIGTVLQQQVFNEHILGTCHLKQTWTILLLLQVPDEAPPCSTLSINGATRIARGECYITKVHEVHAWQHSPVAVLGHTFVLELNIKVPSSWMTTSVRFVTSMPPMTWNVLSGISSRSPGRNFPRVAVSNFPLESSTASEESSALAPSCSKSTVAANTDAETSARTTAKRSIARYAKQNDPQWTDLEQVVGEIEVLSQRI